MGFHAVAFGLDLGHSVGASDILRLIAKSVIVDPNGENEQYDFSYELDEETEIKFDLHEDIVSENNERSMMTNVYDIESIDGITFKYVDNNKIKIGMAHSCAYMIYLGCIKGAYDHHKVFPIIIEEETLKDLFSFRNKLINEGRLSSDVKLQLMPNCCLKKKIIM